MKLLLPNVTYSVCAMNEAESDNYVYPAEVSYQIEQDTVSSYEDAAKSINEYASETVVIVQHEYGIYGENRGEKLLRFLESLTCPIITTMHTVVRPIDEKMRVVTEELIDLSTQMVTLTDSSALLLAKLYPNAVGKVSRIFHGIHPLLYKQPADCKATFKLDQNKVLLTFGLLGRNKGIENVIRALPSIIESIPTVLYLVVGKTHPGVIRLEGETYRNELLTLVNDLSLTNHVRFIDEFLPTKEILRYLQASDVYIATSIDPQQAVSGTLSYALGTGRAVVTTNFAQAKEIIHADIGRVVPIGNAKAISVAVTELLSQPELLLSMDHNAYTETRTMLWSNIAEEFINKVAEVAHQQSMSLQRWPIIDWNHVEKLSDEFGMLQFSNHAEPLPSSGYTLDDNSRALQVVLAAKQLGSVTDTQFELLSNKYLQIMKDCLNQQPVVNYLSASTKIPTEQNSRENLSDSLARAYYTLETAKYCQSETIRNDAAALLEILPQQIFETTYVRSAAQLLLGAIVAFDNNDQSAITVINTISNQLVEAYRKHSTDTWHWFDSTMTYANGQLCSSLLEAARVTHSKEYRMIGLESLAFLCKTCFMGDIYMPVGQNGWYSKNGSLAVFDQQPEDPFSMMQALESAYKLTNDKKYVRLAEKVFSWFLGNNILGTRIYDDKSGGCHDGLTKQGANSNEGAESTVSYFGARLIMERLNTSENS